MENSRISSSNNEELDDLEASLAGTLKRVKPPRAFVRRLRGHIHMPPRREIAMRLHDWQTLFLVFGGVVSGLLVLLTIARALFHLVGKRHLG